MRGRLPKYCYHQLISKDPLSTETGAFFFTRTCCCATVVAS